MADRSVDLVVALTVAGFRPRGPRAAGQPLGVRRDRAPGGDARGLGSDGSPPAAGRPRSRGDRLPGPGAGPRAGRDGRQHQAADAGLPASRDRRGPHRRGHRDRGARLHLRGQDLAHGRRRAPRRAGGVGRRDRTGRRPCRAGRGTHRRRTPEPLRDVAVQHRVAGDGGDRRPARQRRRATGHLPPEHRGGGPRRRHPSGRQPGCPCAGLRQRPGGAGTRPPRLARHPRRVA